MAQSRFVHQTSRMQDEPSTALPKRRKTSLCQTMTEYLTTVNYNHIQSRLLITQNKLPTGDILLSTSKSSAVDQLSKRPTVNQLVLTKRLHTFHFNFIIS